MVSTSFGNQIQIHPLQYLSNQIAVLQFFIPCQMTLNSPVYKNLTAYTCAKTKASANKFFTYENRHTKHLFLSCIHGNISEHSPGQHNWSVVRLISPVYKHFIQGLRESQRLQKKCVKSIMCKSWLFTWADSGQLYPLDLNMNKIISHKSNVVK